MILGGALCLIVGHKMPTDAWQIRQIDSATPILLEELYDVAEGDGFKAICPRCYEVVLIPGLPLMTPLEVTDIK